ncbi:MAG: 5'/3'-nucleotidase SurE [Bacteroidales bacterium]|jgi:5'-nucleotidase|nr:5'/3'-nucleotidase SurE [Bacteroidales bacterium]MCB9029295.1 5'/3'-nucleotidase SurE [Bacteroidales bacterium]MDD3736054.1 5'/3'-nucleotidase SurE [Bacteroidales bacterium]NLD64130.1 5'/3'-nucleotidase SurE [Bacteroidales bacterium]HNT92948.1 5'/3'-nucleotidase SurE [Bacteroidales bacterium]
MKVEENDKLILITNDDGLYAGGLRTLIRIMEDFGKLVVISTTDSRSAMSQALTVKQPIRVKLLEEDEHKRIFACSGTPADGVKLAVNQLLERKPDLIASGINHGSNASASILYSGTMAAALEGCLYNITSVGFSLNSYSSSADFSGCDKYIRQICSMLLSEPLPPGICLNVNFPALPAEEIRGMVVARQASGNWQEEFERRKDPAGKTYYWLTGSFINHEPEASDTDDWAIQNGFVSVVPVTTDMTAYRYMETLKSRL